MHYPHDPDAYLDYRIDWSSWLDGDTIDAVEWITSDQVTLDRESHDDTTATVWARIDAPLRTWLPVTCRITTAAGRVEDRTFTLVATDK